MHKSLIDSNFATIFSRLPKKPLNGKQNATRHYSETFSREVAIWLKDRLPRLADFNRVLPPEGKVPTCFGEKSLDIGCLDKSEYLSLDISIKTFNFKDKITKNYTHNFTGRFYELLGECLDLRLSYPKAVLVALIFLPKDSCDDGTTRRPSSFAKCIKQFSKIAIQNNLIEHAMIFEHVFIGIHDEKEQIGFFNACDRPPRDGLPASNKIIPTEEMLKQIACTVKNRTNQRDPAAMQTVDNFQYN